jgi:hypothetical protein
MKAKAKATAKPVQVAAAVAMAAPAEEEQPVKGLAVGQTVHYHPDEPNAPSLRTEAATVAYVVDAAAGRCNLAALSAEGVSRPVHDAPYSAEPAPGTWSWPKKV